MRIGVIGLGAIGGVVAERLLAAHPPSRGTHEIALAGGRHADALRARFPDVRETLQAPCDFILLCTRTTETQSALAPAEPLLARDGAVGCLQNGLPEEKAAAVVGAGRVLGAVIGWSASMRAPGDYAVTGGGEFILGGTSPRAHEAAEILRSVFPVRETGNLAGARWSKLALNCAMSTLGAVSGL